MCKCHTMTMDQEKKVMINGFIVFSVIQTIFVIILCSISMAYLSNADVSFYLPVDIATLLIGIIFLSLILVIVAWSSALNNNYCLWAVFHCFMIFLLLTEMAICILTSNVESILQQAQNAFYKADVSERINLQLDLNCCGFLNTSDHEELPCPDGTDVCCAARIQNHMENLRNTASVALFVCFVFGMFIDFAGCGICFHPDTITYDENMMDDGVVPVINTKPPVLTQALIQ